MSEPTKWTPERALEMLRDWRAASSAKEFAERWPDVGLVFPIAFEALESAVVEIAKLRAELAAKQAAPEQGQAGPSDEDEEMDRIDHLVYCADPSKIQQWMDRHKGESEADYVKRKTFEALQAMAKRLRRAGVKL